MSSSFIFSYPLTKTTERAPNSEHLKVMQANVFKFNFDYEPLIKQIQANNPDIIALAETTPKWREALTVIEKDWPYIFDHSQLGSHGMIIFSKYPLLEQQKYYFGGKNIPTLFFQINWNNDLIQFASTHPLPPVCIECFKSRDETFDGIATKLSEINIKNKIVLGDMNVTMFAPSYKDFIHKTNLINTRENLGLYPTWPTNLPAIMRLPIDHILHSDSLKTISFKTLPTINSDHLPTTAIFEKN